MPMPQYTQGLPDYSVTPANPLQGLMPAIKENIDRYRGEEDQLEMADMLQNADPEEMAQWMAQNPERAEQAAAIQGFKNKSTQDNAVASAYQYLTGAMSAEEALRKRIALVDAQGGDSAQSRQLLALKGTDPAAFEAAAKRASLMTLAMYKPAAYKALTGADTASTLSPLGKLVAEKSKLPEGDPLRARYDAAITKQTDMSGEDTANIKDFDRWLQLNPGATQQEQAKQFSEIVRASKVINEGGGQQRLVNPLTGLEDEPLVTAEDYTKREVEQKGALQTRKQDLEMVPVVLDKADKIFANIGNLQQAYGAIQRGAGVGPIQDLFPSITAAGRELESIRGSLALDIVGASQFGALSAGELSLAMRVGLPDGLDEPALRDYIERKVSAQQKLAQEYVKFANYLQNGGSRAEWMRDNIKTDDDTREPYVSDDPLDVPVKVTSQAEVDAMPAGTLFIWTDGQPYTKGAN